MVRKFTILSLVVAGLSVASLSVAQGSDPIAAAIGARKAHMQLYGANIGVLGAMAQGNAEYDADAAQAAADNIVALVSINQRFYWPQGSAVGEAEDTRALPALWENMDGVMARVSSLTEAAAGMQAAAGTDLASLQAAMGALGGACGGCHEDFRQPR